MGNVSQSFLWYARYNFEYLTLNKKRQAIQTHHSTLELLFWACCFVVFFYIFSRILTNRQALKSKIFLFELRNSNLCNKKEQICAVHSMDCFPCLCLYLNNYQIVLFFLIKGLQGKGGGHFFNSSLPLPPASQTLRHWPGDYCWELTSAHS